MKSIEYTYLDCDENGIPVIQRCPAFIDIDFRKTAKLVDKYVVKKGPQKPRMLELGPGAHAEALQAFDSLGYETVGLEFAENMAAYAQKNSPNSEILIQDVFDTEFDVGSFNLVFAAAFIHCFPEDDARNILKNIHNWLKPGGIIYLSTTQEKYFSQGSEVKKTARGKNAKSMNLERFRARYPRLRFQALIDSAGFDMFGYFNNITSFDQTWQCYLARSR